MDSNTVTVNGTQHQIPEPVAEAIDDMLDSIERGRYRELCDSEARKESTLYRAAGTLHGAVERAGYEATSENFSARCDQEREAIGRIVEVLTQRNAATGEEINYRFVVRVDPA